MTCALYPSAVLNTNLDILGLTDLRSDTMKKFSVSAMAAVTASVFSMAFASTAIASTATGNIGVVSKYVLRGITGKCDPYQAGNTCIAQENQGAALQGGLDYSHDSGFYAGYWASSLDYSDSAGTGTENDLYAGFAGGDSNAFNYKVGLIQYYYTDVDDSNLTEALGMVGYGPISFQAQYLLNDGAWGNAGDVYWTLNGAQEIGSGFKLGASLGYFTYNDDEHWTDATKTTCEVGRLCGTKSDGDFRHFNVSLSHPIANTGATMSLTYILAGKDRFKNDYKDTLVLGVNYGFDL